MTACGSNNGPVSMIGILRDCGLSDIVKITEGNWRCSATYSATYRRITDARHPDQTRPLRMARLAAAVRVLTPSLLKMLVTWVVTVR